MYSYLNPEMDAITLRGSKRYLDAQQRLRCIELVLQGQVNKGNYSRISPLRVPRGQQSGCGLTLRATPGINEQKPQKSTTKHAERLRRH